MHSPTAAQTDPLTNMSRVIVSPSLEMLAELQALMQPAEDYPDSGRVRDVLGEAFVRELQSVYRFFHGGNDFVEFVIDQSVEIEPEALIESLRAMSNRHFLWLVLGRIYPESDLPEPDSRGTVETFVRDQGGQFQYQLIGSDLSWCDQATETREKVADLWARYFDHVFQPRKDKTVANLEAARMRKEEQLAALGGKELYRRVSGCDDLPEEVPQGHPYETILYVPVSFARGVSSAFFGYGTILLPFDIRKDDGASERNKRIVSELSRTLKVLADPRRLRILQIIAANDYKFNGQRVADYMELSTSVVSRHLSQLRDAGLIEEHSPDNRNILYRVRRDALEQIGPRLLDYIRDNA